MSTALGYPTFRFAVWEDGTLEVLSPWHPFVAFSREVLGAADGRRLEVRGDELTFRCANGGATYALGAADPAGCCRGGRLVRSWGPGAC